MFKFLLTIIFLLSAYLLSEQSVERYDVEKEEERQRIREMIWAERRKLMQEVQELRRNYDGK